MSINVDTVASLVGDIECGLGANTSDQDVRDAKAALARLAALAERTALVGAARDAVADPEAYAALDRQGDWCVWHGNACHQETPEHYGTGPTEEAAWHAALPTAPTTKEPR